MTDYTEYINFTSYLTDFFNEKKASNPAFSVRAFAKFLGLKNPTLLNDVLRKKRKPTVQIAVSLCRKCFYPKHQTDYLVKICEYERAKNFEERGLIMVELRRLLAHRTWKVYDLNQYDFMNHPHVLLIYSFMALKDFKPTLSYINKKTRLKITQSQLTNAIDILVRLKHVTVDKNGNYKYSTENAVVAAGDAGVTSEITKKFHVNNMALIKDIFIEIQPHERDVRSTTLAITKSNFKLIVDEIVNAHQKIMDYGMDNSSEEVYIFSTQLIPITK